MFYGHHLAPVPFWLSSSKVLAEVQKGFSIYFFLQIQ